LETAAHRPDPKPRIVIFSAPSGAGKTTILHAVLRQMPNLRFSVSATTRPPRPEEKDGRDYYFFTSDRFFEAVKHNEFVEWQEVYPGRYYGTLKSEVERLTQEGNIVVFEVDVMGGINLKKHYGAEALALFINPPSLQALHQRLKGRATESSAEIERRITKAEYEMGFAVHYDKVILNDNLQHAVQQVMACIDEFTGGKKP
jgi:guanylate kinase